MERRKIIIYAIFVIAVAYGIYFHFLSGGSKGNAGPAVHSSPAAVAGFTAAVEVDSSESAAEAPMEAGKASIDKRPRNPFLRDVKVRTADIPARRRTHYVMPVLSAVSPGGPEAFVIANGRVLKIGESTGVWTLLKAENGRALFAGPDGNIWVNIGG